MAYFINPLFNVLTETCAYESLVGDVIGVQVKCMNRKYWIAEISHI